MYVDVRGIEEEVAISNRSDPSWREDDPSDHLNILAFDCFFYKGYISYHSIFLNTATVQDNLHIPLKHLLPISTVLYSLH